MVYKNIYNIYIYCLWRGSNNKNNCLLNRYFIRIIDYNIDDSVVQMKKNYQWLNFSVNFFVVYYLITIFER